MNFAIFGNHPQLALAEFISNQTKANPSTYFNEILIGSDFDFENVSKLAGTVKAGKIHKQFKNYNQDTIVQSVLDITTANHDSKYKFGISVYNLGNDSLFNKLTSERQKIGLTIKKGLKQENISTRYVDSKENPLSSVVVITNKLVNKGQEFVLFATKEGILIGETMFVQNFKAWSDRDYGRPARDPKSGMLPPKLARMMINLAGQGTDAVLLDPFCGSGTILMEAALLGYNKTIGSDLERKAYDDTKENLEWVKQNISEDITLPKLFHIPTEKIDQNIGSKIACVVSEVYLGPPQTKQLHRSILDELTVDLISLYKDCFTAIYKTMADNATATIAFPVYRSSDKDVYLPLKEMLDTIGFKIQNPLEQKIPGLKPELTKNGGLLYRREGQLIGREILLMKK